MPNRKTLKIIVLFIVFLSVFSPTAVFSQDHQPPLETNRVESIFKSVPVEQIDHNSPEGGPYDIGDNFILNPDAESGTSYWTGGTNDFIQSSMYGIPGLPTPQDPGPADRGSYFFRGSGTNPEKNAWQTWGIPAHFDVASGKVHYTLSGYFGGSGTRTDRAILRVYFGYWVGSNCIQIRQTTIGPVTAAQRGYQTGLLERKSSGYIPSNANCVTLQLQMLIQDNTSGTAYADNLSLTIDGVEMFLPQIVRPAATPSNNIPTAPTTLTITETNLTSLGLSWKDNSNNEDGFLLQRAIGTSNNYTDLATLSSGVTTFTDKGLNPATVYKYRVAAFNGKGYSAFASVSGITADNPTTKPAAPAYCWTSDTGTSSTNLGWIDSSDNELYFVLEISYDQTNWIHLANVEPDATWVTVVDLAPTTTTYFAIYAFNAAGYSAGCRTSATTISDNNILTITNSASYPIVSLIIDGYEQFPVNPMGLLPGNYFEIALQPGYHEIIATTGFWDSKTSRFLMYSYYGAFTTQAGYSYDWDVPDVSIENILTQFSADGQGYWEGYYFDANLNCRTAAFRFSSDGTYKFYVAGSQQITGVYSLTQRLPDSFSVKFAAGGYVGWLFETDGFFYMSNGPASWKQITYVHKPQGYVHNPFCP